MIDEFNCHVASDAALSNEFAKYLSSKSSHSEKILEFVESDVQNLLDFSKTVIELFDEARDEYNASVSSYQEQLHFVPNLKRNVQGDSTYLRFIWGKLQNKAYRALVGRSSEPGFKELKPGENGFYTLKKLNSYLSIKQKSALPLLLETEHVMRFVRLEYERLMSLRRPISFKSESRYQQLRVKEALNQKLVQEEREELRYMNLDLMLQVNKFDPYKMPVKKSMFKSAGES